jgi:hypothetical protein
MEDILYNLEELSVILTVRLVADSSVTYELRLLFFSLKELLFFSIHAHAHTHTHTHTQISVFVLLKSASLHRLFRMGESDYLNENL